MAAMVTVLYIIIINRIAGALCPLFLLCTSVLSLYCTCFLQQLPQFLLEGVDICCVNCLLVVPVPFSCVFGSTTANFSMEGSVLV